MSAAPSGVAIKRPVKAVKRGVAASHWIAVLITRGREHREHRQGRDCVERARRLLPAHPAPRDGTLERNGLHCTAGCGALLHCPAKCGGVVRGRGARWTALEQPACSPERRCGAMSVVYSARCERTHGAPPRPAPPAVARGTRAFPRGRNAPVCTFYCPAARLASPLAWLRPRGGPLPCKAWLGRGLHALQVEF